MNPQHFGRDPADIRIRFNPAIRIGIPDHFLLKFGVGGGFRSFSTVLLGTGMHRKFANYSLEISGLVYFLPSSANSR